LVPGVLPDPFARELELRSPDGWVVGRMRRMFGTSNGTSCMLPIFEQVNGGKWQALGCAFDRADLRNLSTKNPQCWAPEWIGESFDLFTYTYRDASDDARKATGHPAIGRSRPSKDAGKRGILRIAMAKFDP